MGISVDDGGVDGWRRQCLSIIHDAVYNTHIGIRKNVSEYGCYFGQQPATDVFVPTPDLAYLEKDDFRILKVSSYIENTFYHEFRFRVTSFHRFERGFQ